MPFLYFILSSPSTKPLFPKPSHPIPNGLRNQPITHPLTFKHKGGLPQQKTKDSLLKWSPLLDWQKIEVDSKTIKQSLVNLLGRPRPCRGLNLIVPQSSWISNCVNEMIHEARRFHQILYFLFITRPSTRSVGCMMEHGDDRISKYLLSQNIFNI